MNCDTIINNIINECQISKFNNIYKSCNDKELKRKTKDIINYFLLKNKKQEKKDYDIEDHKIIFENDIEKLAYMRPWNKLHEINKIIKMREFVDNLEISNSLDKKETKIILENLIKERKLNSSKIVDYDYNNIKILSIKGVICNNGLCEITIK